MEEWECVAGGAVPHTLFCGASLAAHEGTRRTRGAAGMPLPHAGDERLHKRRGRRFSRCGFAAWGRSRWDDKTDLHAWEEKRRRDGGLRVRSPRLIIMARERLS